MKNLKIVRSLSIILVIVLFVCIIPNRLVNAKDIYFSGVYSHKKGAVLSLSEYTGPTSEEERRHEVATFQFDVPHAYNAYNGILVKIGKNKYRSKKKGLIFKVYKKKVIVKVTNKKYDKDLKGTYKLIRHFYS
ncbi:MAG: hypothetical protein HFH68_15125 [Lachnospiraceae bacterium]|nr:hypothetical protein [Lachnospiraceae bacterium]